MSKEIKEILDRIETASEIFDCLLKPEECTELLNYITNLQQKVEQLENIRKEAIESIERGYVVFCEQDKECLLNFRKNMLNILNKGSEDNVYK